MTSHARPFAAMTILSLLTVALCQQAEAAVAFDNLGSPPYTTGGTSFGYINGTYYDVGMQFTATETITLDTLELALGLAFINGVSSSGTAQVELRTDAGNTVGTVLETWTSPTINGAGVFSFTSLTGPTLTDGTKYWVVLRAAPGSQLGGMWYFTDDGHAAFTLTMSVETGGDSPNYTLLSRGFRTRLSGDIVPEPASGVLAVD